MNNTLRYSAVDSGYGNGIKLFSCFFVTSVYCFKILLDLGLKCMIGKGERNDEVCSAICRNEAVYLCAIGGAGALAAASIDSCEVIAYEDLGCESVKKLEFNNFPLFCAIDSVGGNLFK